MSNPARDYWGTKEAASQLGISVRTLLAWVEKGVLRALQPGGEGTQLRFLKIEVERVKERERGAA